MHTILYICFAEAKKSKVKDLGTQPKSINNSTLSIRDVNASILYTRDINNSSLSIRDINTGTLSTRSINNSTLSIRNVNNSTVSHNRDIKNINQVILNLHSVLKFHILSIPPTSYQLAQHSGLP
ncbi:hypothetical protein PoB_006100300 [Plakobranchus ocellatus]|uniref:Uncharacterized protein n=1 Tax=Plakobranchus ocellatus TaxID=259542 RepID=A0AAV4CRF9_9GAST|nr:hypothetical protein PoB_006100300 [Plakobranchus ocellatus]